MVSRIAGPVAIVALAVLTAALATGCASSTRENRAQSSNGAIVIAPSASPPAGFSIYHGDGFSFAVPRGYQIQPADNPSVPLGASATTFSPAGEGSGEANAEITAVVNPNFQYTLAQAAASLGQAEASDPSVSDLHTAARDVTVPGAKEAQVINESYLASNPRTVYQRTWLMVYPRPGLLIDLVVVLEPDRGATLSPNTVLDSFRLDG